jgi:hypothetical protein
MPINRASPDSHSLIAAVPASTSSASPSWSSRFDFSEFNEYPQQDQSHPEQRDLCPGQHIEKQAADDYEQTTEGIELANH